MVTRVLWPVAGVAAFVGAWWAWSTAFAEPGSFQSGFAPDRTAVALAALLREGTLTPHVVASLQRIAVGLGLAAILGIPFGLAVGGVPAVGRATGVVTGFVRMISPLSWTPLAIIWFGVGNPPVYFLIAVGAIWPISLSTSAAVAALERQWLMLGRSLRASRGELLRTIVWPGIRGEVLTGLRLGLTTAWIILVPAEMLGVDSGLGYFILDARDRFAYADLMAALVVIGAIGFVLDRVAGWALTPARRARDRRVGGAAVAPSTSPHAS